MGYALSFLFGAINSRSFGEGDQIDLEEAIAKAVADDHAKPDWLLKRDSLTAYSLRDWLPEEWLIYSVLPSGELIPLYGPSRIGKFFLVVDIAMSLATGIEEMVGGTGIEPVTPTMST